MTDAAHMLSDTASFAISLFAMFLAKRAATKRYSFGFYRAEVLGALVSILTIWLLTGVLVYMAVLRVKTQAFEIESTPMLITASCGVAFNIILGLALSGVKGHHGHSHSLPSFKRHSHSHGGANGHSHSQPNVAGHSHQPRDPLRSVVNPAADPMPPDIPVVRISDSSEGSLSDSGGHVPQKPSIVDRFLKRNRTRTISTTAYPTEEFSHVNRSKNINVRAALIHVIGDLVQSVGVLIAAILIKVKPEWKLADPICTFIFSVLVLFTTLNVIKDIIHVLMEGTPSDCNYDQIKADLEKIPGVHKAHSLHLWSLTMDKAGASVHLAIDPDKVDGLKVMEKATRLIRHKYNVMFLTVQVEPYDAEIMPLCHHCTGPVR